jgi:hypothetical protein
MDTDTLKLIMCVYLRIQEIYGMKIEIISKTLNSTYILA